LKGQATVLWGYDAVPTAAQNIPLAGVRGKYGKKVNLIAPLFYLT
jgi:hypothetical protein